MNEEDSTIMEVAHRAANDATDTIITQAGAIGAVLVVVLMLITVVGVFMLKSWKKDRDAERENEALRVKNDKANMDRMLDMLEQQGKTMLQESVENRKESAATRKAVQDLAGVVERLTVHLKACD